MPEKQLKVADNFIDAFNNLGLARELSDKDVFGSYYVQRQDRRTELLKASLHVDKSPSKILYSGHRKSGNTTELYRLIFELQEEYFTVYYSSMGELELGDISHIDILLVSALKLCDTAISQGLSVDEDLVSDIVSWLNQVSTEVIKERVESKTRGWNIGAKLKPLIAEIGARFRSDATSRQYVREKLTPRTSEVIEKSDQIAETIRQQSGKEPLLIIDDLNKLTLEDAKRIFSQTYPLTHSNFKIIYTLPISLALSPEFMQIRTQFARDEGLSMIKTRNKNGEPFQAGWDFLKQVILKRMSEELFEQKALEHLIEISNGVLSDLLSVAQTCCVKARADNLPKITWDMVDEEYETLTNSYRGILPEEYYPKLTEIYQNKGTGRDEKLLNLLYWLAALQYDQGEWYDVHPAIVPLLKQKGLLER